MRKLARLSVLSATLLLTPMAALAAKDHHSGYLRDYSQLKAGKDANGEKLERWVSPKLSPATYHSVLVDAVELYPEPSGAEKVSAETMTQVTAYMTEAIKKELAQHGVKLATEPGPGAVRLKAALTAIDSGKRGLKVYQLVPIALVATTVKRAATGTPVDATLFVECEVTDSATGEPLLRAVRTGKVEDLAVTTSGDRPVTLDALKPLIDRWAIAAAAGATSLVDIQR